MLSTKVVAESRPTETASYTHKRHLSARPSTYPHICQIATHLTNSKMAETADELLFVKSVGSLLHAADEGHLLVPLGLKWAIMAKTIDEILVYHCLYFVHNLFFHLTCLSN